MKTNNLTIERKPFWWLSQLRHTSKTVQISNDHARYYEARERSWYTVNEFRVRSTGRKFDFYFLKASIERILKAYVCAHDTHLAELSWQSNPRETPSRTIFCSGPILFPHCFPFGWICIDCDFSNQQTKDELTRALSRCGRRWPTKRNVNNANVPRKPLT